MRYANEDFIRLISAVEAAGGELSDDSCHADEITFEMPGDRPDVVVMSSGCEEYSVFHVPYDPSETVLVPEPVLEPDPKRSEWVDAQGDSRVTRRTKTVKQNDGSDKPVIEIVERAGMETSGGLIDRSSVTVCAYEDNVGMWPRFAGSIQDKRSR